MANDSEMRRTPWRPAASPDLHTITLTSDSTSPVIDMSIWAAGGFVVTGLSGAASLNYFVATGTNDPQKGGAKINPDSFVQLNDSTNAPLSLTLSNNTGYKFVDDCFPFPFVQLRTNAGTATITLCKKT